MNKLAKIVGWVLGILGIALGAWCLSSADSNPASVDVLLRFTYALFIAAVVVTLALVILKAAVINPKGLIKAAILLVIGAALVFVVYSLAAGNPVLNVKSQPSAQWLKLTDTMMLLTAILGAGAVCAIIFGVIRNAVKSK